ncbi:MAG: hypothetical protein PUF49_02785 [Firmicutes bacterium]|nr:hypothetical protein [Bacillota bacterium]
MSAISTGRIKGQKKKYGSVLEAAKQFRGIACDPAVAPEDHDWHWVVCADALFYYETDEETGEYVQKKSGKALLPCHRVLHRQLLDTWRAYTKQAGQHIRMGPIRVPDYAK